MASAIRPGQTQVTLDMAPSELWDAADRPVARGASRRDSEEYGGGDSWDMGASYGDAKRLARQGWPEGLDLIAPALARVDELVAHALPEPQIAYDVIGDAPDVGAFLAGVPENMLTQEEAEGRHRMIRVLVNVGASCGVSAAAIRARGTMACALVDALEKAGYRCEVLAVWSSFGDGGRRFTVRTLLKRAEEALCLDRLVFALVHPAFMRRILFRIMEQIEERAFREAFIASAYGRPGPVIGEPGDVVISEMYGSGKEWTPARIAEEVARYLKEVGVHMEGEPR